MTPQEMEEFRQMLELQAEMARQRLRTVAGEAFVDDVLQKMAINRAVFAAGYGIDPRPYAEPPPRPEPITTSATPAPQAAKASSLTKWGLIAAAVIGGGGVPAGMAAYMATRPDETPAAATEIERDQWEFRLMPPLGKESPK